MRVLIVPDSFKGSLTSQQAAQCIRSGIQTVFPDCEARILPVADGGEGTVEALLAGIGGERHTCRVCDPLGRPVDASFAVLRNGTAVIEMAQASGLPLLSEDERNPERTSSYGTGQLITAALDQGCRQILIGIGGSATNDGGAGMAAALGARFLDRDETPLPPCGSALAQLERIDIGGLDPRLKDVTVLTACDVDNPLCGPRGASAVYGPQKGADEDMVERLDAALAHYGEKLAEITGKELAAVPGAGAAGGLGAGLMAFCHAALRPGIEIIFELLGLEEQISWADIVFTGEGRVDATSANGKLLSGIGGLAEKYKKPVVALAGSIAPDSALPKGIQAVLPIADGPMTLERSLAQADRLLTGAAARAARLLQMGQRL